MTPRLTALAGILFLLVASAANAQSWRGVTLDPRGLIRPELLSRALRAYAAHAASRLSDRSLAIVDFSKPSSERCLFLLDLQSGAVQAYLVAHGRGSDLDHDAIADRFSDEMGSHASSLGGFRGLASYQGGHGLSLSLEGLDPSNRSALQRAVVLHSQWYVSDRMVAEHGKLGRSWGCFVVDRAVIEHVVARLSGGGFIYADR